MMKSRSALVSESVAWVIWNDSRVNDIRCRGARAGPDSRARSRAAVGIEPEIRGRQGVIARHQLLRPEADVMALAGTVVDGLLEADVLARPNRYSVLNGAVGYDLLKTKASPCAKSWRN